MLLKVKVSYPEDMSELESKLSEGLTQILIKKLTKTEVDKLIEILGDDSINMIL